MLILTRNYGETLMIGDEVSVTITGIKGNLVSLGINAPQDIEVHREEIYRRIQAEKQTGEITASRQKTFETPNHLPGINKFPFRRRRKLFSKALSRTDKLVK